jgi:ABC-2 type transport system permease protein
MHTELARLDLRLRRRGLWAYSVGMGAYAVLIVAIYPTFKDDASLDALASGNSSLGALLGISGSLTSPSGWMNANIYANFLPLVVLLMTIGYGASAVAGQDEDGALGLTAALPVGRISLALQKVAALVGVALPVAAVTLLAGLAGRRFQVTLETGPLVAATFGVIALGVVFGLLALLIGALTGSRATALGVTSAVAVLSYVISALAPVVSWVHDLRWASPFYWSVGNGQLTSGIGIASAAAIVVTAAVLAAAAVWAVDRMDIH